MRIELITIGDEILSGMTLDTNSNYLAKELFVRGYRVSRKTTVPDTPEELLKALKIALESSDVVITTGGLGPTVDDKTREIMRELFGGTNQYNKQVAEDIRSRFGNQSVSLEDQATIPSSATPFLNPVGTAPGLLFSPSPGKFVIVLPGVPLEMQSIFSAHVLPLLEREFSLTERWYSKALHFCLLYESTIDPLIRELANDFRHIEIGIYPAYGFLTVVLRYKAKSCEDFAEVIHPVIVKLKNAYPTHYFPYSTIEEAVQHLFVEKRLTLALAESCTGGSMAQRLTKLSGASEYFLGSMVTYSNFLKENVLGVSPDTLASKGAVSAETVNEMLMGVFKKSAADYAVVISGIAGPDGGSKEKPVGTVWAAIGQKGQTLEIGLIPIPNRSKREAIIAYSGTWLFASLWRKVAFNAEVFSSCPINY